MRIDTIAPFVPRGLAALLALSAALAGAPVRALGLGGVLQQSALGQPLRLVVQVIAAPGEELAADCFRLATTPRETDGIPQIAFARVALERTPTGAQLVIASSRPVNDPVVRVSVQAGCDQVVRRDYTLLLDPPAIDPPQAVAVAEAVAPAAPSAPMAAEGATAPSAAAAQPPAVTGERPRAARKPATKPPRSTARRPAPSPGVTAREAGTAPARPEALPPAAAGSTAAPPAKKDAPRLRISAAPAAAGGPVGGPSATPSAEAQAQAELAQALEAETVVLRQRIAELSAMVDRMDQEIRAATAARLAAEAAANASPLAAAVRWWDANWPVFAAIVGLAALVAGGLLLRRRRVPVATGEWPITRVRDDRFAPSSLYEPVGGSLTQGGAGEETAETAAAAGPERGKGRTDAAHAVAVSELAQITEEARVYVTLGHVERAMDVLREHVAEQPGASPAAWLMLLDLYRTHGKEKEFRQLAEEFHLQFNAQTPQWDTFADHQKHDLGVLAFPHIVEQLTASWRSEDCRSYLERLLFDNRQGRRMGFSLAAYGDILLLRQMLELLLAEPDRDGVEEAKLRAAWAAAQASEVPAATSDAPYRRAPVAGEPGAIGGRPETPPKPLPALLELDLELDLEEAGGADTQVRCRLETEHPALLRELTREWGRPAGAKLLAEIVSGTRPVTPPLSAEAFAEIVLLQGIAAGLVATPRRR